MEARILCRIGKTNMEKIYQRINWNTTVCNGNMNTERYLHSQISRAICLSAYEKPLSVEEISAATGIPAMFVEDELAMLEYGDAVRKIGKKYAADFIILSLKQKEKLDNISTDLAVSFADFFEKRFKEKSDDIRKINFYGNDYGIKRLGYIAVPYILRNLIRNAKSSLGLEDGEYPARKDGGYGWFIIEETADEREGLPEYASGCILVGNESKGSSLEDGYIYYYWIGKYFEAGIYHGHGISWLCDNNIPQNSVEGKVTTPLSDEDAAHLIRNSLICKSGDNYMLGFPCFSSKSFEEFVSIFDCSNHDLNESLSAWIKALRNSFASFVPNRLASQINQWVFYYANQITGFVSEELVSRGVLEEPRKDKPMTYGICYIEGKYQNPS